MARFEGTDQRYFWVPCPECSEHQKLEWRNIKFDRDESGHLVPGTTRYACGHCGALLENWQKGKMLEKGEWRPDNPGLSETVRGYHLSALYAPVGMFSWEEAAAMWCEARRTKSQAQLKTFVNTVLGETWKEQGDAPDWELLYRRREEYPTGTVPAGAWLLTAGVDIQLDRIELELVGWGPTNESWSLDFIVLEGNTAEPEVWTELEAVLAKPYPHELGGEVFIKMTAVDAGYQQATVLEWARRQDQNRTMAIKGANIERPVAPPVVVDISHRGKKRVRRGASLWKVGSSWLKGELYTWLRAKPALEKDDPNPAGWCHWPDAYPKEYFLQLTAECLVTEKDPKGFPKRVWRKNRERNEALDCRVYARAAAIVVGVDRWKEARWLEEQSSICTPDAKASAKTKKKPSFLQGGASRWQERTR